MYNPLKRNLFPSTTNSSFFQSYSYLSWFKLCSLPSNSCACALDGTYKSIFSSSANLIFIPSLYPQSTPTFVSFLSLTFSLTFFIPQMKNVKENVKLRKETKVGVDCGYSDGINIKFAEDEKIDLYVPSRAQAQEFDGKEQSLNHDKYEYDAKRDELIVSKYRFYFKFKHTRKN